MSWVRSSAVPDFVREMLLRISCLSKAVPYVKDIFPPSHYRLYWKTALFASKKPTLPNTHRLMQGCHGMASQHGKAGSYEQDHTDSTERRVALDGCSLKGQCGSISVSAVGPVAWDRILQTHDQFLFRLAVKSIH